MLAGSNEIEKVYNSAKAKDGIDWLEATPKKTGMPSSKVRLGFKGHTALETMEMHDHLRSDHRRSAFSDVERNPRLDADSFDASRRRKGADVMASDAVTFSGRRSPYRRSPRRCARDPGRGGGTAHLLARASRCSSRSSRASRIR